VRSGAVFDVGAAEMMPRYWKRSKKAACWMLCISNDTSEALGFEFLL